MSLTEPVLELTGAVATFGRQVALAGVDLTLHEGERVALLGPSGAGKSTLLKLADGALDPTDGRVRVFGEHLSTLTARRRRMVQRRIGSLTQDLDLIEQVRVLHNVNAGRLGDWSVARALSSLVSARADGAVEAGLARVGLSWAVHARTEQLSGGERQRVAIARLLIQAADFVVADEPVSSLDPTSALDVLRLLGTSTTTGTLLVSLHQPELVRDHFSRAVGLRAGRVTFDVAARDLDRACLDELYARP